MNADWTLETGGAFATALFKRVLSPNPKLTLEPGDRLGPYRLVEMIGRGGSSVIFRGARCDGAFEQEVAIKVLLQAEDDGQTSKWDERNLLARLVHPAIAQIHDGGTTPEGIGWFAMELVPGATLRQHFERRAHHWKDRLHIVLQVVEAIGFAHSRGVVHGDIKPANILVDADGSIKLLDFGIANAMETAEVSASGAAFTPGYASPEQLIGAELTAKSDIYQLGLLIEKHLLAPMRKAGNAAEGEEYYQGDAGETITVRTQARLRKVCARATHEAQSQRHGSVSDLRAELVTLLTDTAPELRAIAAPPVAAPPVVESPPPVGSTRRLTAIVLTALLLLAAGNAWLLNDRYLGLGAPVAPTLKAPSQPERRELDRLALELRTRFDGDWMKRVVAVEGLAKSYWQLEAFQEAHRLAQWAADEALRDDRAQRRERLRLLLLALQMAPLDTAAVDLYAELQEASALLEESSLGEFSIEGVELLTLTLETELRYGSAERIEEVSAALEQMLARTEPLPGRTRAQALDSIGLLRILQAADAAPILAALQASSELRDPDDQSWSIERLRIAMLRVILAGPEQAPMFAEFMRGLRDIEARHGNTSDSYAVAKLYFAIILFESGREQTLQRADEIFAEVGETLSGRGSDFLGHLVLAESYHALSALKLGQLDVAQTAAARAASWSEAVIGRQHPLRRVIDAAGQAVQCGRLENRDALRGARAAATSLATWKPARAGLADLMEFAVLADCLGAEESLLRIGMPRGAIETALAGGLLSPRLHADVQAGLTRTGVRR